MRLRSCQGCSVRAGFKAVDRFNKRLCNLILVSWLFCRCSLDYMNTLCSEVFERFLVLLPIFFVLFPHSLLKALYSSIVPSLLYFLSAPPAEKVTPRHKHPLMQSFSLPPFSFCLTLFQSFQPSFILFFSTYFLTPVSTTLPFIFCPLLGFALSFWIFLYFSPSFSFPVSPQYNLHHSYSF